MGDLEVHGDQYVGLKALHGPRFEKEGQRSLPALEGRQQGEEGEDRVACRVWAASLNVRRQHPDSIAAECLEP